MGLWFSSQVFDAPLELDLNKKRDMKCFKALLDYQKVNSRCNHSLIFFVECCGLIICFGGHRETTISDVEIMLRREMELGDFDVAMEFNSYTLRKNSTLYDNYIFNGAMLQALLQTKQSTEFQISIK